jgi:hypothetical protein
MKVPRSLYSNLAGIGVELYGVKPNRDADIEHTILLTSTFVESEDRRLLGLLASWVVVHAKLVCVGKLKRLLLKEKLGDEQIISALAFLAVRKGAHEWGTLTKRLPSRRLWGETTSDAVFTIKGAEESFSKAGIQLPKTFLRIRASDILSIERLAKVHLQTRLRLIFGANTRADAVYYLSKGASSASDLMRKAGCSYEPAHRIMRELRNAGSIKLPEIHFE